MTVKHLKNLLEKCDDRDIVAIKEVGVCTDERFDIVSAIRFETYREDGEINTILTLCLEY